MTVLNKFIKKIKKIEIKNSEYLYLNGAGWIKSKDFDNLPNNLKKTYYWELENLNEDKLKQLQSDAVNELLLLNDEQLKKTLKRLDFLNEFERFNEFIKSFYVKVDNNTYNGLDVSDFKILLNQCFYVDVPNTGNISIEFLNELTEQIFFKSALLDGLKWQIENLLPIQEQTKQTEKPKPELKLKDFFIKDFSSDIIVEIQTEFKELEGKDLAILIYLLHREHKIIEILTNSRTKGRKGFVKCLKETDNPTMQKVNKCFVPNTDDLIYSKHDLVFQSLNKRLTKTIKK